MTRGADISPSQAVAIHRCGLGWLNGTLMSASWFANSTASWVSKGGWPGSAPGMVTRNLAGFRVEQHQLARSRDGRQRAALDQQRLRRSGNGGLPKRAAVREAPGANPADRADEYGAAINHCARHRFHLGAPQLAPGGRSSATSRGADASASTARSSPPAAGPRQAPSGCSHRVRPVKLRQATSCRSALNHQGLVHQDELAGSILGDRHAPAQRARPRIEAMQVAVGIAGLAIHQEREQRGLGRRKGILPVFPWRPGPTLPDVAALARAGDCHTPLGVA